MRLIIFLRRKNKMTKEEERKAYDKLGEILTDALNNLIAEEEGTTCQNCGEPTGYGRGSEPTRYDTLVCSTKCARILYNY